MLTRGRAAEAAAAGAVLLACLAVLYAPELANGFTVLRGDPIDMRLADALQLHWFDVLRGREWWNHPGIFHPAYDTLGYNDGYLLFGLLASVPHALGLGVLLSCELAAIPFRIAGFAGLYVLARVGLRLPAPFSLLAASVAVLANNMRHQELHVQLLAAYLAPAVAALLVLAVRELRRARAGRAAALATVAALLTDAWALTGFYTLLFTAMLAGLMTLAAAITRPRAVGPALRLLARPPLAGPAIGGLAGLIPTLRVYLPTVRQVGSHPWAEISSYVLRPVDLVDLGADHPLGAALGLHGAALGEHTVGLPPLLWCLAIAGAALAVRRGSPPLLLPLAAGSVGLLLLASRLDGWMPWRLVLAFFPPARAVRVVCRVMLLLAMPAALLAATALARFGRRGAPPVLLALLGAALVAEELGGTTLMALPRRSEERFIAAIAPPPADCPFFTVSRARPMPPAMGHDDVLRALLVETDASFLAERIGRPTVLGYASFPPPGFDNLPTLFEDAAKANGGHPVCAVDLVTGRWSRFSPPLVLMRPGTAVGFSIAGGSRFVTAEGWSPPEAAGRWTTGTLATIVVRAPAGAPLLLTMVAAVGFSAAPFPREVVVRANGVEVARWAHDPVPISRRFRVPAGAIGADGAVELVFEVEDPRSPARLGLSPDTRRLGLFVVSMIADPA